MAKGAQGYLHEEEHTLTQVAAGLYSSRTLPTAEHAGTQLGVGKFKDGAYKTGLMSGFRELSYFTHPHGIFPGTNPAFHFSQLHGDSLSGAIDSVDN